MSTSKYVEESERYYRGYETLKSSRDYNNVITSVPIGDVGRRYSPVQRNPKGIYTATPTRTIYPRQTSAPPLRRSNYATEIPQIHKPPLPSYDELRDGYNIRTVSKTPSGFASPPDDPYLDYSRIRRPLYEKNYGSQPIRPPSHSAIIPENSPQRHQYSFSSQPQPNRSLNYPSRPGSPQQVIGVGEITNNELGFTIQLDVKHFQKQNIKIKLSGNNLIISGERIEEDPQTEQTLKRSFSRKYSIPTDIQMDSIRAHLTDYGHLLIRGKRRNWKEVEIDIEIEPENKAEESLPEDSEPQSKDKRRQSEDIQPTKVIDTPKQSPKSQRSNTTEISNLLKPDRELPFTPLNSPPIQSSDTE